MFKALKPKKTTVTTINQPINDYYSHAWWWKCDCFRLCQLGPEQHFFLLWNHSTLLEIPNSSICDIKLKNIFVMQWDNHPKYNRVSTYE